MESDRAAFRPPWEDLHDLGAEQALGLDLRLGAIAEPDVLVDLELDQNPRTVQGHAGDLADLEAGDLDRGLRRQAADLLEVSGVLLRRVDERKLPERQRDQYGHRGQTDADRADDDGVALREELHFGVHRPVDWPATLMYTGSPPLPLTFMNRSQR